MKSLEVIFVDYPNGLTCESGIVSGSYIMTAEKVKGQDTIELKFYDGSIRLIDGRYTPMSDILDAMGFN